MIICVLCVIGDLWGPLLIGLLLSSILSITAPGDSASLVFATVFVIVWLGAAVVTVNAQLLGGTISFFQSLCILGYCVFPLTLAAFTSLLLKIIWRPVSHCLLCFGRLLQRVLFLISSYVFFTFLL